MSIRKSLLTALSLFLFLSCLSAQNTNSPYSRYGFGSLESPALGKNRAMGGIGYGLRDKGLINPMNPASYSSVDTLNFVFDFGVSSAYSFFKENDVNQVNPNGKFDYVAMKVPLKRYWGLAVGLMPFSSVGYSYSENKNTGLGDVDYTETHVGTGGLNTLFLGTGVSIGKHLSLGANLKYVFGAVSNVQSVAYTNTSSSTGTLYNYYEYDNWYLGSPNLDFGIQYQFDLGKKKNVVIGASFTNASVFKLHDVDSIRLTPSIDTTSTALNYSFDFPKTFGFGISYTYDNRLTVGLDYEKQCWSESRFFSVRDSLSDNTKISFGVEYLPAFIATNYFQAIKYRFGAHYTDSYLNFSDGNIKDVGISLGFGLPLRGQRSSLNFAIEAGRLIIPSSLAISERYYKISLGVSFNELWFFKRKL